MCAAGRFRCERGWGSVLAQLTSHVILRCVWVVLFLVGCGDTPTPSDVSEMPALRKVRAAPTLGIPAELPAPVGAVSPVLQDARDPRVLSWSQDGVLLLFLEAPDSQEILVWDTRAEAVRARAALGGFRLRSAASSSTHWQLLSEDGMIATLPLLGGTISAPLPAPCPGSRFIQEGANPPLLLSPSCVAREVSGNWQARDLPIAYDATAAATQGGTITVLGRTAEGRLELAVWHTDRTGAGDATSDARIALDAQASRGFLHIVAAANGRMFVTAQGAGLLELDLGESAAVEPAPGTTLGRVGAQGPGSARAGAEAEGPASQEPPPPGPSPKVRIVVLDPAVQDAWPLPDQNTLWTLEGPHLVRRQLDGIEQERSFWGADQTARPGMKILQLGPARGLLLLGEESKLSGMASPVALISLEPWQQLRLLKPLPRVHPCGMAWLPQAGLAALVLLEPGNDVLTTRLMLVGKGGGSPVEVLKVGLDPLPKDQAPPSTCQVIVSQDERILGIAAGNAIKLYDRVAKERAGHSRPGPVVGMAFSPDGGSLVYGLRGGELFRVEVPALDDPVPLTRYEGGIEALVSAVDSDALAVVAPQADGSRRLELFAAERRQVLGGVRLERPVSALSWAAGALRVAVATEEGQARWWMPPGPRFSPLPIPPARQLRVSPDAKFLAGAGTHVFRWKAGAGLAKAPLPARTVQLDAVPQGGCIAVLDDADRLSVYASEGGGLRAILEFLVLQESRWVMRLGAESAGPSEALRAVEQGGERRLVAGNFALDGSIPVSLKQYCPG